MLAITLPGCQKESQEITEPPPGDSIAAESRVIDLIRAVTMRDGSDDNILDHSSCVSEMLPVTVKVNGHEVLIVSEDDFDEIDEIFESSQTDEDTVALVFPVKVILPDYSEVTVTSQSQLDGIIDQCDDWGDDNDNECIDFKYPVTLLVCDIRNQVTRTQRIADDRSLFEFFGNIPEGLLINFKFPVTMILPTGSVITVDNIAGMEAAIENANGLAMRMTILITVTTSVPNCNSSTTG